MSSYCSGELESNENIEVKHFSNSQVFTKIMYYFIILKTKFG